MTRIEKYTHALTALPPSGGGGCHTALLGVATRGVLVGVTDEQIFSDLRRHIRGERTVTDREILDAIARARKDSDPSGASRVFTPPPSAKVKPEYLQSVIGAGRGIGEPELLERSKIKPDGDAINDGLLLLETLYGPDDVLFLGERFSTTVRTVRDWIEFIGKNGSRDLPHIIPNPLTGNQHTRADGGLSYRCDNAVRAFRFAMVEFDNLSRDDQLAFWAAIPLPVAALIDSGGKSIHGWIKLPASIRTAADWQRYVENDLYQRLLIPLGVDPACRNEARLSRFPGHYRADKGAFQRLLYLDPDPPPGPILSR